MGGEADFGAAPLAVDIDAGGMVLVLEGAQPAEVGVGCRVVGSGLGGEVWKHKRRLDQSLRHLEGTRLLLSQIWRERWQSAGRG